MSRYKLHQLGQTSLFIWSLQPKMYGEDSLTGVYMSWILLLIAGLFEVLFAFCLGKTKDITGTETYFWYSGFLVSLIISMSLLIKVTQTLPIGTSYAVWTGIGAIGTVVIGILFFKEPMEFWRLFFLSTLVLSVVGLKLVSH